MDGNWADSIPLGPTILFSPRGNLVINYYLNGKILILTLWSRTYFFYL